MHATTRKKGLIEKLHNLGTSISYISYFSFCGRETNGMEDVSVILPLFQKSSKYPAMIKHGMDVIKTAIGKVNKDQTPVIVFDQPLYASSKDVQWN